MAVIRRLGAASPAPSAAPVQMGSEGGTAGEIERRRTDSRARGKDKADYVPRDLYQEVTDTILAAIENGTAPWQRRWDASRFWPINPTTKKPYHGINVMLLAGEDFQDARWCSYQQAQKQEWQVRKGERGTKIFFYKPLQRPTGEIDPETGTPEVKVIPILKSYTVFNLSQMDNAPPVDSEVRRNHVKELSDVTEQLCQEIVEASGAEIVHGYRQGLYRPSQDKIYMPDKDTFESDAAYYAVLLHEIGHWSGHKSRLNREFSFNRESPQYAREELRAEMASAMLSMRLGLPAAIDNHSAYVDHYLQLLRSDKKEIFRAAKDAEKISRYVLSFHPDFRDEFENEHRDQVTAAVAAGAPEEMFDATDFDFEPDPPLMGMRP